MLQRDQRLQVERERMQHLKCLSDLIDYRAIASAEGLLPDRYEVTFLCKGLVRQRNVLVTTENHRVMIYLHSEYPTQQPRIAWLTPIFHPNIKGHNVCLGRSWTPTMTLDDLCLVLGEMVQYKLYNLEDPLDGEAATIMKQLISENPSAVPVDTRNLLGPEIDLVVTTAL